MTQIFQEQDRVRVAERDVTTADVKSQLFFEHYRGLVGHVRKVYADGTASVTVEMEDLTPGQAASHKDVLDWVRNKELERLSEEAKNKLSAADKKFAVPYAILVSTNDLTSASESDHSGRAAGLGDSPARKSLTEIEEAEARHLEELRKSRPSEGAAGVAGEA